MSEHILKQFEGPFESRDLALDHACQILMSQLTQRGLDLGEGHVPIKISPELRDLTPMRLYNFAIRTALSNVLAARLKYEGQSCRTMSELIRRFEADLDADQRANGTVWWYRPLVNSARRAAAIVDGWVVGEYELPDLGTLMRPARGVPLYSAPNASSVATHSQWLSMKFEWITELAQGPQFTDIQLRPEVVHGRLMSFFRNLLWASERSSTSVGAVLDSLVAGLCFGLPASFTYEATKSDYVANAPSEDPASLFNYFFSAQNRVPLIYSNLLTQVVSDNPIY